jgi:hypothetical protein
MKCIMLVGENLPSDNTVEVENGSYAKYKAKFREKKSNLYVKGLM